MITGFKFNNCFAFNKPVEISLKGDMRTKRFSSNIIKLNEHLNILKSAVIYGPNNTGKTSFINCISALKETLSNRPIRINSNIFTDSNICEQAISFIFEGKEYDYEYQFDCEKREYVYEKMTEILKNQYKNETLIFERDSLHNRYECPLDSGLKDVLAFASTNNICIYTVQVEKFEILKKIKKILTSVADNIEIVYMNKIPISKTIEILKNKNEDAEKIVKFIKNADTYLEDFMYVDDVKFELAGEEIDEKIIKEPKLIDQIKLVSVYKGQAVPSMIFDSLGTKKIAALASYVVTAIEKGKTLIIDELDSSLHFKITRAIMSMFNSDLNKSAQIIATLHDISLLDCKRMFRKEQIWFTNKDDEGTDLYSLKEFSYAESGVRDTSDIQDRYSKGAFGAIPEPDLISTLLEVDDEES